MSITNSHSLTESLYRDHQPWLKDWLRRKLGCSQRAADLAQDTFVRVMCGRTQSISEARGYLATIARGLMVDMFRRQAVESAYLEALAVQLEPESIELEAQAIIIETLVELDRLLDQLGSRTRSVFLLAQLEGLTQVEIGQRLNISLPTVRKHLVRAFTECLLLVAGR
ncbi:sigma-70 family RNA polymerase sigma factor [Cellvibrio sp. NN19]|uniref:sigma-70 family RNA polymerase sigma factor n=1 Tax=Cellvibrio chitinivorans TaxID=3102792 RepID=UPI002B415C32|nr:sigma-70 family RNA polymerase sigma factor [Cellvibrio sp. NN19]